MDSWRQQHPIKNEDEALAKALELSLLEQQGSQGAQRRSTVKLCQTEVERTAQASGPDFKRKKGSQTGSRRATPLCLPNNLKWDSSSGKCIQTGQRRTSLYVMDEALEDLRRIRGPVCVVSIAGPYRKGKSFVLSEAFNQPQVFPLGHHMEAETMGIWSWIVPEKFRDAKGQEFTVVLLDSEGIDAANGQGLDDNQIFTLMVLLASVLIYNSQGVPTRRDLEGLDFIAKLSQRIEMRSTTRQDTRRNHRDSEYFHKTFPFFIWLLRDVTQAIPRDCIDIKDYFLKKLFQVQNSSVVGQESGKVAESILSFFPGFEAFALPPPTTDIEVLRSIHANKSLINPSFLSGMEDFKDLVRRVLLPKKSINVGESVTGEGLAALVELYVQAINTPGMVPNVQNAWDQFLETKCSDAMKYALDAYEATMALQLKDKLPCDNDRLRNNHAMVLENSEAHLKMEMLREMQEEIKKFREQMDNDLRAHREQMKKMMEANMQQAQKEREQELRNQILEMQKINEETLKMIKKLSDLVVRQEDRRLDEEMQRTRATMEKKEMLEQMEAKHQEEKERLRCEMEAKIE
ncbi:guanylate-binding protein 6-like isoform X2 [Stylophora pistillata]|uniref:guanylate-binding protein 6-like isoform X2 n=1 Tax=Stylophora pistillata TaxID=50429 RepID=UPI000C03C997|nr:guanylate-binding protein 6-like isoform X2 [Stylophora pistillata]